MMSEPLAKGMVKRAVERVGRHLKRCRLLEHDETPPAEQGEGEASLRGAGGGSAKDPLHG